MGPGRTADLRRVSGQVLELQRGAQVWPLQLPWPFWVWPLIGGLFVPWTTLAYLIVFPGGVVGLDWVWLGLGLLFDLGSHFGGGYRHRDRIRGHGR